MSANELLSCCEELAEEEETLSNENEVFEEFLRRKFPECLQNQPQIFEQIQRAQTIKELVRRTNETKSHGVSDESSLQSQKSSICTVRRFQSDFSIVTAGHSPSSQMGSLMLSSASRLKSRKFGLNVILAHRIDLTTKEIAEMKKDFKRRENIASRKKVELEEKLNEIKLRAHDLMEMEKFSRENESVAEMERCKNLIAYLKNSATFLDDVIYKVNLQVGINKAQIRELKRQLIRRRELGDSIRPVDFEKLAIECEELKKESDELQAQLTSERELTGHLILALKDKRQSMKDRQSTIDGLRRSGAKKSQELKQLREGQSELANEIRRAEEKYGKIRRLLGDYQVPTIDEFSSIQVQLRKFIRNRKKRNNARR